MTAVSRRALLAGTGAAVAGAVVSGRPGAHAATPAAAAGPEHTVLPGDVRYPQLMTGNNQRFVANPQYFRMLTSTSDAEQALRTAVTAGRQVSVRSGGHCFADFVCNPDVQALLDLSGMTEVTYDPGRRAYAVQPGARLLNIYQALFNGWGVTIPGGMCWSVGAGGHVAGGGYGLLSRAHGLVVDHLDAVEVVVVDANRDVRTVVATRDPHDPNHDLWWAHTGGGGGNFGIVTRYWFRSPAATGTDPTRQLIRPPATVLVRALSFPWDGLSEQDFTRLLRNFGQWHADRSQPGSVYGRLSTVFNVCHKAHGTLDMFSQIDGTIPNAEQILDEFRAAMTAGTSLAGFPMRQPSGDLGALPGFYTPQRMPWLNAARLIGLNDPTITHPALRGAHKSALLRKGFTDHQLAVMYEHLISRAYWNANTMIVLFAYGGQVNAVPSDATATAERSSVFKMLFQTFWADESGDAGGLGWARGVYEEFFDTTGGVPTPGPDYGGCYVNYPDVDLTDPAHNRSAVPWHDLYYQHNYPRLQHIKRRWDPTNVFHHSLSIIPA